MRKAQWFDLCPMTDLFFKEMVEVMKEIAPAWHMRDMHTIMWWLCEAYQLKKPSCFKIREDTPNDMEAMLSLWQHNPEGVPATIWQEDDSLLNLSDVDIWMWLRAITPTKSMMVRQCLMQLFGEASQWASLVDISELPEPCNSKLCNSIQTEYKSGSQPSVDTPLKDLAIWLDKQAGVTLTCVAKLEEYAAHALAKTANSSTSQLQKHLHETARTKDHLNHQKWQLVESTRQDSELSVIAPTNQLSMTASPIVTPPPYNPEGGSTKTWLAPALYSDGDVHMVNVDDSVTNNLYQEGHWVVGFSPEGEGVSSV